MLFWSLGHNWSLVKNVSFCPVLCAAALHCWGKVGGCSYGSCPSVSHWASTLHLHPGITVAGQTAQGCCHHHALPGCPNWERYLRGQRSAMHRCGTAAAVQDVAAAARVFQGLALVSVCKAKMKPRTTSLKLALLSVSVCTCHPAQQYL